MRKNASKDGVLLTGAQCQFARNKLGMTQAQLAKAVEVSRSQIANFETKGERFTPSAEVREKLRDYFESEDASISEDFAALDGASEESASRDNGSAVASRTMQYIRRLADSGCFRMSSKLSEAQRDRLLAEIDKAREELEEIAASPAQEGFFDRYNQATDERIEKADALIKKFGFLCIVAFDYGFVSLPTPSLVDGKRKPKTIADALAIKYADAFKQIGIRKNDTTVPEGDDESQTRIPRTRSPSQDASFLQKL